MNDDVKSFIAAGLKIYPEARATLTFFEREISDQLAAAEKNQEWFPLKNPRAKPPKAGEDGSYFVSMFIEGLSPHDEPVKIDCGIWWGASKTVDQAIIYASFYDAPKHMLNFRWECNDPDIRSEEYFNRTFLYLPATDPAEIGKSLNQLLNELLKQLSRTVETDEVGVSPIPPIC